MKVDVHAGDIIFKRVHNGWIVQKVFEDEVEYTEAYVVEDISDDPGERIWRILWEVASDENR